MKIQLLREEKVYPEEKVIENALGRAYSTYIEFIIAIQDESYGLVPAWNYYKDGKAWLCKIVLKNKTILWLSIWKTFFKASFYFTEKTIGGIHDLAIDEKIKESLMESKNIGKLIPVIINVKHKNQLYDLLQIIMYKKNLK